MRTNYYSATFQNLYISFLFIYVLCNVGCTSHGIELWHSYAKEKLHGTRARRNRIVAKRFHGSRTTFLFVFIYGYLCAMTLCTTKCLLPSVNGTRNNLFQARKKKIDLCSYKKDFSYNRLKEKDGF